MATSRLAIYNGALVRLGLRTIASLTVNEEGRRLLDDVWNDGGVQYCLEQGLWRFATRTQMLDYNASITPDFGYRRAFDKSSDWIATSAVCSDEYFQAPLLRYQDEQRLIYCDLDRIYVRFVSNAADWGMDLSIWPSSFTEYVKTYFAGRIANKATGDKELAAGFMKRGGLVDQALLIAKNNDAQLDPPKFPPPGSWVAARRNRTGNWRDGGNRHSLIG